MNPQRHFEPWVTVHALSSACCRELRRRAIFECCKWDPQVEDVDTLAPMAVVLQKSAWEDLQRAAESLSWETMVLEEALARSPDFHKKLAIPRRIRNALADLPISDSCAKNVRVMRFDFHPTEEGWRVSEVNTDVPGGYNEASGWASLVAEHVPHAIVAADPAAQLVDAICEVLPSHGTVALVHATAYTDDRQVMTFLAQKLQRRGFTPVLAGPDHIRWHQGRATIHTDWFSGHPDFLFRFFPAEWLPNLGQVSGWAPFFGGMRTPLCNPATALLTQSKRWPLVANQLGLELPAWRRWMTETRDPREVDWKRDSSWVLKPALGRVGESIGMAGVTDHREWKPIRNALRWGPGHWVAQQRFTPVPMTLNGKQWHVCFGVYTVNGRAAGIYGRASERPLINHLARDLAVLVQDQPCLKQSEVSSRTNPIQNCETL